MRAEMQRTLDRQLAAVDFTPRERASVLRSMRGGAKGARRRKPLVLAVALLLTLLSVTAVAVGTISLLYRQTAKMQAQDLMLSWELEDKLAFVSAMREAGLDMDETDWAILSDVSQEEAVRGAAADRIVYARYGELQERRNATYLQPSETVVGEPPDIQIIFTERYLAEHPGSSTEDQAYLDALGYFMRDEWSAMLDEELPEENKPEYVLAHRDTEFTQERAIDYARSTMTEVFSWTEKAYYDAVIATQYDEEHDIWTVTCDVTEEDLKGAFEPRLDGDFIEKTENGYRATMHIGMRTDGTMGFDKSVEEIAKTIEEENRWISLFTIHIGEAMELASEAVKEKYGLTDEEVKKYFIRECDIYDGGDCVREGLRFNRHNNYGNSWDYAVIVNFTTAEVEEVFTREDMWARFPQLAQAYFDLPAEEFLHYYRWFTTWSPEFIFESWPLERQAAASEAFWEAGQDLRAKGDEHTGYSLLWECTRHHYAVPGEGELNLGRATTLGIEAVSQALGVPRDAVASRGMRRTFAVDDPEHPVWRILFLGDYEDYWKCYLWLDGRTGEVLYLSTEVMGGNENWSMMLEEAML